MSPRDGSRRVEGFPFRPLWATLGDTYFEVCPSEVSYKQYTDPLLYGPTYLLTFTSKSTLVLSKGFIVKRSWLSELDRLFSWHLGIWSTWLKVKNIPSFLPFKWHFIPTGILYNWCNKPRVKSGFRLNWVSRHFSTTLRFVFLFSFFFPFTSCFQR